MTITHTGLEVRKIGGRIGAEIGGVDLDAALDDSTASQLNAALLVHKVVVLRGQHLDDDGQTRFAAAFGPLTAAHPTVPSLDGNAHVLPVEGGEGARANTWHTDVTFVLTPPKASTLRALVVPPYGGDTLIANTAAAYGDLPRRLHRVTVAGDVPVGVDGRRSYVIEGDEADHYTPKAA